MRPRADPAADDDDDEAMPIAPAVPPVRESPDGPTEEAEPPTSRPGRVAPVDTLPAPAKPMRPGGDEQVPAAVMPPELCSAKRTLKLPSPVDDLLRSTLAFQ